MVGLKEQFLQHWQAKQFCPGNGVVLLACSGGLDSMVLAHLLLANGVGLAVAHCNFRLRGEEANADEALVRDWAHSNSLPFFSTGFDTKNIAAERKDGIQQTARDLRYAWLEELRAAQGFSCIATAHHSGDVTETVLINLMRGAGIAGLHGIPERQGSIIRPLLFAEKDTLKAYAQSEGIAWREDVSNQSNDYTRNAIRNVLLPQMEKIFPQAAVQIAQTAGRIAEAEVLYRDAVEAHRKKLIEQRDNDWYIPLRKLQKAVPRDTLLFELLRPFGFTAAQTVGAVKLITAESGRSMSSATHRLIRDRDFFIITELAPQSAGCYLIDSIPAEVLIDSYKVTFKSIDKPQGLQSPPGIAYINADALEYPLMLRRRRIGDYFYPIGMNNKKKKVGRFLNDLKLPAHQKDNTWVLESNHRIVWIVGLRLDERFKVTTSVKQVLKIDCDSN